MKRKSFLKAASLATVALTLQKAFGYDHPFTADNLSDEDVVFFKKTDASYNGLRNGFNKRIDKFPAMIALCLTTKGVQQAIVTAKKMNLTIRVKSGGHSMEGFSTGNDCMQIVLKEMNSIQWNSDYEIMVGPACLLKDIYAALLPKNKILPGGSCATVALGGLTLGGGYGLMSRLLGLTCDSLQSITMVDGNGRIVLSNKDTELLWACRGGANGNFGIITELTYKVHDAPKAMSSYRFRSYKVSTTRGKEILKTWFEESKLLPKSCFSTCLFNGTTTYILLTNISVQTAAVTNFIDKMRSISDKYSANVKQPIALALKNYYGLQTPILFKNASSGLYKSFDDIEPIIEKLLEIVFNTRGMIYQVNLLGGAIQKKEFEDNSSFPHRDFTYFSELQTYWDAPATGKIRMEQFEKIQELIFSQGITAQYRNYPDINFKNATHAYYAQNLPRLQSIKKKYDPENIIQHEQSVNATSDNSR